VRILALDLGNRTGFACGVAGGPKPRIESWLLKKVGQPVETSCRNLACSLRDNIQLENPDLIVAEHWLHPAVQPSADVIITQLQQHGVVEAIAGVFGIRVVRPTSAQFRTHFCGQSSAGTRRKGPRTERQKADDREATNMMVVRRAILLGYLPHGSTDWDKASAAGLYDYASAVYGRTPPRELILFGEQPREAMS